MYNQIKSIKLHKLPNIINYLDLKKVLAIKLLSTYIIKIKYTIKLRKIIKVITDDLH